MVLLDTDTCFDVLRGLRSVLQRLQAVSPDDCSVSSITAFELRAGELERTRVRKNLESPPGIVAMKDETDSRKDAEESHAKTQRRQDKKFLRIGEKACLDAGLRRAQSSRFGGVIVQN